jgi:hypothetical protein
VRPVIEDLQGKGAGYREAYEKLQRDPCSDELGAYRLSGPLEPIVCGVHLKRGYRLAFTMQPPEKEAGPQRVVVLYVGLREPRHRETDVWTILHDLFDVENPPENHLKPPCCQEDAPDIDHAALDEFLKQLRALRRTSRARRRRK